MSNKIINVEKINVEKIKTAKDIQRISLEVLKKDAKFLKILEEIEKEAKKGKFDFRSDAVENNTDYEFALIALGFNVYKNYITWKDFYWV